MGLLFEIYKKLLINESISIDSITDSIKNKYQVVLNYEGDPSHGIAPGLRTVEVYAYGLTKAGNPVIRAFQPYGDTASKVPNWKFFRLDRIKSWEPTYHLFSSPAIGFNHNGDKSMSVVYSIANFNEVPSDNITGARQVPKEVGKLNNIDKILADREKEKKSRKEKEKTISRFNASIPNKTIAEPQISGSDKTKQVESPPPNIKGVITPKNTLNNKDNDDLYSQDNNVKIQGDNTNDNIYKTSGDEQLAKIKDLNNRMNNVRKIDLSKIPKR